MLARIDQARHIVTAAQALHRGGLTGRLVAHKHLFLALIENRVCHSTLLPSFTLLDLLIDLYTLHLEAKIKRVQEGMKMKRGCCFVNFSPGSRETQASNFSPGSREAQIVEMLGIEDAAEEVERLVIGRVAFMFN